MNPDLKAMLVVFLLGLLWTRLCWFFMTRAIDRETRHATRETEEQP